MDRLDVAATLIDVAEEAVDVPVRTRGSGDHSTPVILVSRPNVNRRSRGNSAKAGTYDENDDGLPDGTLLQHIYEGSVTIEARSQDEVESYNLIKAVKNRLATYEEYPATFHEDLNELTCGNVQEGGFQAPMPEPVYKHTLSVAVDYADTIEGPLPADPIQSIEDNVSNS